MKFKTILLEKEEGIGIISLNRPERRNAINQTITQELVRALDDVAEDEAVKVVIITGKGEVFCAGGDIKGHPSLFTDDSVLRDALIKESQDTVLKIHRMNKIVIAAINGIAGGAGLDLAMNCDLRIASETATFAEFFVKQGVASDWGGSYFLPKLVGIGKALEMLLTGDSIDAQEALRLGLVNYLAPQDKVLDEAKALARRLADGPLATQRFIKRAFYAALHADYETTLDRERHDQVILIGTQDVQEAIKAFREKRKPVFKGK